MKALFPHMAMTRDLIVRVSVSYLPEQSEPAKGRWFWAYHIRLENDGAHALQLLTRHWIITDGRGARHEVRGEGVVGEQPLVESGRTYDYVSGCPLQTPTGAMEGSFHILGADGSAFDAKIPRFPLIGPAPPAMKRTHLPLNALRVLDAAARHLSFTRAADELAVTPAAVGQQVRALEDTLGVVLFKRTAKGLELTPEAAAGLGALRDGFLQFEEAVRAIQAGQTSKTLTIAAPRDLTARWLAPRLAQYGRTDPELRFVLIASDDELDFTQANLDLAIRLTDGPGEHEGVALPATGYVRLGLPDGPDRAIAWPGQPADGGGAAITVADAGLAIDAAAQGFGHATVPTMLADADRGALQRIGPPIASDIGYWLIAPIPQWRQRKVKALVAALSA